MDGGGGGQMTSGASAGKSRPRDGVDPGPVNAPSGRSSNPKRTEPCGGTTPQEVPTTGEGRWNDGRSCFTFGTRRPEPTKHANHHHHHSVYTINFLDAVTLVP